jgi:hypothetical protein
MEVKMLTGSRFKSRVVLPAVLCWLLVAASQLGAVDFIRGDSNEDGVVSIADSSHVFIFQGHSGDCPAASDWDNDETVRVGDFLSPFYYLMGEGSPPAAPFPDAGPDTTSNPTGYNLPCTRYGGRSPVVDPAAQLEVLDAVAPGGDEVHAVLTIRMSNSVPVGGFAGRVLLGSDLVEDAYYRGGDLWVGVEDFTGDFAAMTHTKATDVKDGVLRFGIIHSFNRSVPQTLPPGTDVPILQVTVCLEPGTPAGDYPLTFEAGELVMGAIRGMDETGSTTINADAGYAIHPTLVSGTLTVLNDVLPGTCQLAAPLGTLDVSFTLLGATGGVGGDVEVPLVIRGDRECQGFGYAVAFDPEVLEFTSVEKRYPPAGSIPYRREVVITDELDQGIVRGAVTFPLLPEDQGFVWTLPPHQDHEVVVLHFLAKQAGSTEVSLITEDNPYWEFGTFYFAHTEAHTPALTPSFVTTDSLVSVLPDNILFIRGDSNGDDTLDLSDAQNTLNHLFLGGRRPRCHDAADANDDGAIDVSDAIATLDFLFLGRASFSAPFPALGKDPTPDSLPNPVGCYRDV